MEVKYLCVDCMPKYIYDQDDYRRTKNKCDECGKVGETFSWKTYGIKQITKEKALASWKLWCNELAKDPEVKEYIRQEIIKEFNLMPKNSGGEQLLIKLRGINVTFWVKYRYSVYIFTKMATIYTLAHPITNEIKYVGKTRSALYTRLRSHINSKNDSDVSKWAFSLKAEGLCPNIEALELADDLISEDVEEYWITQLNGLGFTLLNYVKTNRVTFKQRRKGKARYVGRGYKGYTLEEKIKHHENKLSCLYLSKQMLKDENMLKRL